MDLSEFFARLDQHEDNVPIDELVALMTELQIDAATIQQHISFHDEHYQRNLIRLGSGYAALALCWAPGQASPIHDHTGSACGVRVIQGDVWETRYDRTAESILVERDESCHQTGQVCGSWDTDIHVLENRSLDEPCVTLHVYTPPLKTFRIYELDSPEVKECVDRETAEARRRLEPESAV